jgi:2-iminobutanoate/2-iminopropanoate deaminase
MKKIILAENAPAAIGPYSHAVIFDGLLFTSGQIPLVPETGRLIDGGIEAQAKQVFRNLAAVLLAANMDFSNVVKATVFLTDLADFAAVNTLYSELFPENPPARSCIQAAALPGGAKIEMELIAYK